MTIDRIEERVLEIAQMALDEPWSDVQGCAAVLAKDIRTAFYDPSEQIAVVWSVEDVQGLDESISDSEAMEILEDIKNHHDAEVGINWDVLQQYVDNREV
jgi:hypothetical protein